MTKTAIFVEGQTELIFVREFLMRWFDYQGIRIECFNLFDNEENRLHETEHAFGEEKKASQYFQIINVGMDGAVLSRVLYRENFLWNSGFHRIIGLRDMYGEAYKKALKGAGKIDEALNQKFIEATNEELIERSKNPSDIHFHFAIMEIEAWILGLNSIFERIDASLTNAYVLEKLGYDLASTDPETAFLHPTNQLKQLFQLVGRDYDKHASEVNSILRITQKTDYELLLESGKCNSFSAFCKSI